MGWALRDNGLLARSFIAEVLQGRGSFGDLAPFSPIRAPTSTHRQSRVGSQEQDSATAVLFLHFPRSAEHVRGD